MLSSVRLIGLWIQTGNHGQTHRRSTPGVRSPRVHRRVMQLRSRTAPIASGWSCLSAARIFPALRGRLRLTGGSLTTMRSIPDAGFGLLVAVLVDLMGPVSVAGQVVG